MKKRLGLPRNTIRLFLKKELSEEPRLLSHLVPSNFFHIFNAWINLSPLKMKSFTQKFIGILALVFAMSFTANAQEIGDIYEGGYIFEINEDGTGLVADLQDLGEMNWYSAIEEVESCTSQGYDDWDLPSLDELIEMYITLGQGADNVGGFENYWYWSSKELGSNLAWGHYAGSGSSANFHKSVTNRVRPIRSVTFGEDAEVATQNIPLHLPQGWSMFGYTCLESLNAVDAFSDISYNIEIVKDEWGLAYLPSYGFSAFDNLEFGEGYQIKMIEEVTNFQFCTTIAGGASQEELDAAYTEGAASVTPEDGIGQADLDALAESYAGWCASDIDNDGICDVDEVSGCMDASSCNYVSSAEFDDGSCDYVSCLDDCDVINGDNSTCLDCAGVVNGTSEDLGCGCGNPQAQEGYDCNGNELLQIGDIHEGGIVFQINEDGTGLVADLQDLGEMGWYDAIDAAESATSQGYDDWYLPSIDQLELMYNTIGQGGGNIGGFADYWYWSSSEFNNVSAWIVIFGSDISITYDSKGSADRVRVIRAF